MGLREQDVADLRTRHSDSQRMSQGLQQKGPRVRGLYSDQPFENSMRVCARTCFLRLVEQLILRAREALPQDVQLS